MENPLDTFPSAFRFCNQEFAFDDRRTVDRIRATLATLPRMERMVIELAYFEELTHTEIAARLNAPLGTAKSWIRTGLQSVREGLQSPTPAESRTHSRRVYVDTTRRKQALIPAWTASSASPLR
jgi:DNA-directed RNA polymerase specialized sigma24 family protein